MDKVSPHKALSLLALPGGFVFAYPFEIAPQEMKVGYKMVSFDTGKISNVTRSIYTLTKFGSEYKLFGKNIRNFLSCRSALLYDGRVFVVEEDGKATLFDMNEYPAWEGKLTYQGSVPDCIAATQDSLWAAYGEKNTLVRYNLQTLREELRIGGNNSPFSNPVSIFPAGSKLFICNKESMDIWKIDTNDYTTELYYQFEEPVYDYKFIDKYEIVSLESGIYVL